MGTPIQGKIFPMYNKETGANRERRFPITVMEAVLGLPSYLQDQFSSLADIYMPIEGISEAFTGQEFVYRKSPNTIKAKSLTLDRIKGKTLAWNQLLQPQTSRTINDVVLTANADGSYTLNGTASGTCEFYFPGTHIIPAGHKAVMIVQGITNATIYCFGPGYSAFSSTGFNNNESCVFTANNELFAIEIRVSSGVVVNESIFIELFDLTLMGIADQVTTPADFKALYPDIYGYNPGTLISNDAESIETTGVNQWDEEHLEGYYSGADGQYNSADNQLCTKNKIPVFPNTAYYIQIPSGKGGAVVKMFYDAEGNYLSYSSGAGLFTTPANCYYIHLNFGAISQLGYGTTYNHDICFNLSDESINGQYFPYWKRTLQLGLTTKKDTDGNVPFADGMKGAGTAADWADKVGGEKRMGKIKFRELSWSKSNAVMWTAIRNKKPGVNTMICSSYVYAADQSFSVEDKKITDSSVSNYLTWIFIKDADYISSDIAAFLADHGNDEIVYPLDTPVPFTWAEPLINTVKAGTTEARISPNEGSLSAPFCCDITYSASENNDSESAQYAATAGRLLNTRKIWGQDFNGSEDVSGALTGVTNINSLINIASGNVGIGTDSPAHKLDVAGTLRATGLATLGGGLTIPNTADAKHGTLDFIDGDAVKHIVVVSREEDIPASPDLYTLYVVATTTV